MRLTIIESPFWADTAKQRFINYTYAMRAVKDSLMRGESPIASHLLYTLVLDDEAPGERKAGIEAGHAWIQMADLMTVYWDYGLSKGMKLGIKEANACGLPVEFRKIGLCSQWLVPPHYYWIDTETTSFCHDFPNYGAPCYAKEM